MTSTMDRVARICRTIEERAEQVDPDLPYDQRSDYPDYYALCMVKRSYGVPVSVLRSFIEREMSTSEGTATRLISQARAEGVIHRHGASVDTRYCTEAYEHEREQAARAYDRDRISLGARLLGHGVNVEYEMTHGYRKDYSHEEAVRLVREAGKHIERLRLACGLEVLAAVLDEKDRGRA